MLMPMIAPREIFDEDAEPDLASAAVAALVLLAVLADVVDDEDEVVVWVVAGVGVGATLVTRVVGVVAGCYVQS